MDTKNTQPNITVQGDEVLIRIPKFLFDKEIKGNGEIERRKDESHTEEATHEKVDFSYLIGVLKDVPEFQGKTSVEVQHMITDIWKKKTMNYSS